jgi:hypothetical protein
MCWGLVEGAQVMVTSRLGLKQTVHSAMVKDCHGEQSPHLADVSGHQPHSIRQKNSTWLVARNKRAILESRARGGELNYSRGGPTSQCRSFD